MTKASAEFGSLSAAFAYRKDSAGRESGDTFGPVDGGWITVASLLEHAARAGDGSPALVHDAVRLAEKLLPDGVSPTETIRTDRDESSVVLALAEQIEDAGALNLASLVLSSFVAAVPDLHEIDVGRLASKQARCRAKLGDVDSALAGYRRVRRMGNRLANAELKTLAFLGFAALAQRRSDFDEVRRWSAAAARLGSRHRRSELTRVAYNGLLISAAAAGRYDEALVHGWRAYELSAGNPAAMAEVLGNLAQLLVIAGHAEQGQAAWAAVLSTPQSPRIGLPALGGYAIASAALHDHGAVRWAAAELDREARRVVEPFIVAAAALEVSSALWAIHDRAGAEKARSLSESIAAEHGLHEIAVKAARLNGAPVASTPTRALKPRAARVARAIERLRPRELPEHVTFIAA